MISIVVKFNVRPECSDEWLNWISDFTSGTRQESGNLWFEWSRGVENPNRFVLIEGFRDANAGAEHVNSEHFKRAIAQAPSMLVNTPEILYTEIPGTEWSLLAEMSVPEDNDSA
jgi:quinol monooxygenase YgiN